MVSNRIIKDNYYTQTIMNKSYAFFLPMLGEFIYEFINLRGVFIWNEEFPEYDSHIFLLFRNSQNKEYQENLKRLKSFSNYVTSYSPDKFHTLLVFLPPIEFTPDYKLLKNSKYSRISDFYKRHVFKFHNITNGNDKKSIQAILYRQESYRDVLMEKLDVYIPEDQELASILNPEKETYLNEMKIITNVINE